MAVTAKELREWLEEFNDDELVAISDDGDGLVDCRTGEYAIVVGFNPGSAKERDA